MNSILIFVLVAILLGLINMAALEHGEDID